MRAETGNAECTLLTDFVQRLLRTGYDRSVPPQNLLLGVCLRVRYTIADIAFGKSFNLLSEHIAALPESTSATRSTTLHKLDFPYKANAIFRATESLINTLPLFSPFPRLPILVQQFQPSHRGDLALVHAFINQQIKEGRAGTEMRGEEKTDAAGCAIDMVLLQDGTADALSEAESRSGEHYL